MPATPCPSCSAPLARQCGVCGLLRPSARHSAALRAIALQHDAPADPVTLVRVMVQMAREGLGLDPMGTDLPPRDSDLMPPDEPVLVKNTVNGSWLRTPGVLTHP